MNGWMNGWIDGCIRKGMCGMQNMKMRVGRYQGVSVSGMQMCPLGNPAHLAH